MDACGKGTEIFYILSIMPPYSQQYADVFAQIVVVACLRKQNCVGTKFKSLWSGRVRYMMHPVKGKDDVLCAQIIIIFLLQIV